MAQRPNAKYDKARYAAVAALMRVHRGGWANFAYGGALAAVAEDALDARDRAFAGAVFYGATERLATLDHLLAPYLKKDIEKLDLELRAILECGAFQLLYMRVPHSAAVNESVQLARAFGKSSAAGLVNAVLRRLGREVPRMYRSAESSSPGADTGGAAAGPNSAGDAAGPDLSGIAFASGEERVRVTGSVSGAVARAVMAALPEDYDAFFAASFADGWTCLRVNTLKTSRDALARAFEERDVPTRPGFLPEALYVRLPGGPAGDAGFEAGLYHVQGEASQVACACVGAKAGEHVLDLCAAPGGKTATLAQAMGGGSGLTACELRENRLPLIGQTLARLGIAGARVLPGDGTVFNADLAGQHRVLCDAPCSGLGVLAQKPDLRLADGANFDTLPALQLKLLSNASRYVIQGGRLVYSTCTVRPAENEGVVRAFLAENPDFHPVPPPVAPSGAVVTDGLMTLLPHCAGMDGFFVAVLARD